MFAEERHRLIVEQLETDGKVSVAQLSERFEITRETVRRDLAQLESENFLRRVHGGAVTTTEASTREESHLVRTAIHSDAKSRIAQRALSLLPVSDASVIIDAGTTTEFLAERMLRTNASAGLVVITHALPIASVLVQSQAVILELIGGRVRGLTGATSGAQTVEEYSRHRADIAFIGTNGLHAEFGLSTPDPLEAAVKRALVNSARRVVLLADSSKFDQETLVCFARLESIDTLVTDQQPGEELAAALEAADVEVVIA
ncbi:DeoR/GlpR family DNA-binding transcription regulator [Glutamicibacter halophytocola]|uniref:Lactose phosphotransferase system repressor n=1 Tax=Glutamicibacter halophytocola TaxID=1933880 RepID=A0A5B8I2Z3_9MICC|nr:DeoR/GlpR family DNA-binding transcription regulator [Glutamicibacter halophytocola]ALG27828.1 D-beta-D-heptose 1-phosphate adenosyltransferase [Glutamicibacter halophytocola]NQD41024.1 DeoR/GlpR transcriptional regulator [Glutamicibacter halophytocola]QDY67165.1 DeoR/GlpR transcriptional regulator [Glutamicibacter halophytocola]UUX59332.1 DeoR/GlpR family DNA-binding transcription regulator [Glutamicibacter halophytocola]